MVGIKDEASALMCWRINGTWWEKRWPRWAQEKGCNHGGDWGWGEHIDMLENQWNGKAEVAQEKGCGIGGIWCSRDALGVVTREGTYLCTRWYLHDAIHLVDLIPLLWLAGNLKLPFHCKERWLAADEKMWNTVQFWSCHEVAMNKTLKRQQIWLKGGWRHWQWGSIWTQSTFLGADILCAKKQKYLHNPSIGTGGAWVAISWPEAMTVTTWTVNLCRLAHPCRFLIDIA